MVRSPSDHSLFFSCQGEPHPLESGVQLNLHLFLQNNKSPFILDLSPCFSNQKRSKIVRIFSLSKSVHLGHRFGARRRIPSLGAGSCRRAPPCHGHRHRCGGRRRGRGALPPAFDSFQALGPIICLRVTGTGYNWLQLIPN